MILGGDPQMAYHALLIAGCTRSCSRLRQANDERRSSCVRRDVPTLVLRAGIDRRRLPSSGFCSRRCRFCRRRRRRSTASGRRSIGRATSTKPRSSRCSRRTSAAAGRNANAVDRPRLFRQARAGIAPRPGVRLQRRSVAAGRVFLAEHRRANVSRRIAAGSRCLPAEGRTWTPTLYLGLLPVLLRRSRAFGCWSGDSRERWLSWLVLIFTLASFGFYGLGWLVLEVYGSLLRKDGGQARHRAARRRRLLAVRRRSCRPTSISAIRRSCCRWCRSGSANSRPSAGTGRLRERRPRLDRVLLWLGSASAAAAFVIWCLGPGMFAKVSRSDSSLGTVRRRRGRITTCCWRSFKQLALLWLRGGCCGRRGASRPEQRKWQGALLLLTAVEVAVANAWLVVDCAGRSVAQ